MCKFGLEITSVLSGTTCPVQVAQYARYIQVNNYMDRFYKNPMNYLERLLLKNLSLIYLPRKRNEKDDWTLYSNLLIEKYAIHASTLVHVINGFITSSDSTPNNPKTGYDSFTINSLIRVMLESYITFNHIYILSHNEKDAELRYLLWELDGIYERRKFKTEIADFDSPSDYKDYVETEDRRIDTIIRLIQNSNVYKDFSPTEVNKIFKPDKRKINWRFLINDNKINSLKIIELIEYTCPPRMFFNFYKNASFHTHSGFNSIDQHKRERGKVIDNDKSDTLVRLVIFLTIFLIHDITLIDKESKKVFDGFSDEIKNDIIGINKEFKQ